jgi:hypothetical protein
VAIDVTANGIADGFVVIITLDEHRIDGGNRTAMPIA